MEFEGRPEHEGGMIKGSSRTYFFDIEKTKEGKAYLKITESRLSGPEKEPVRNTIFVFPENIKDFVETLIKLGYKIK